MREPYLLFAMRLASTSPNHVVVYARLLKDVERLLSQTQPVELGMSGTFAVEVPTAQGRSLWRQMATLLDQADPDVGNELQWFVHLADRRGCELASN